MPLKTLGIVALALSTQMIVMVAASPALAQTEVIAPAPTEPLPATVPDQASPTSSDDKAPYFSWGGRRTYLGLDFRFVSYVDEAMRGSMGRERQMRPAAAIVSLYGDFNDRISYRVEINPVEAGVIPKPYVPSPEDRRTYFFPNQPDSPGNRGVASVAEGLYNVDDFKTMGLDPILQAGPFRVGYIDVHNSSRRYGVRVGRIYVPQGLGLDGVTWFTTKDLVHIQSIDAAADDGALAYVDHPKGRLEAGVVTGNGSPFHDYGYFDFTYGEDKNSAVATVLRGTFRPLASVTVGGSMRHNYVNSRVEDATTLQLSKRYDNALTAFARWRQSRYLMVYGEAVRYKWGLRDTSADTLPGPRNASPLNKGGYYLGAEVTSPKFGFASVTAVVVRSELSRDDSLVAWAAANSMFDVRLGKKERSNVVKIQVALGRNLTAFWFLHRLSNPFPELSAITPIAGPGSDSPHSSDKNGLGVQLRF